MDAAQLKPSRGERLLELYQEEHRNHKRFLGYTGAQHAGRIKALVDRFNSQSILDYGCGKGSQYLVSRIHEKWGGILPHCYDPGWPPLSAKPNRTFSGVICTDVMEHVPAEDVRAVIEDLFAFAEEWAFLTISCVPSTKDLPDGTPCHITVEPPEWWEGQIQRANIAPGVAGEILFMDGRKIIRELHIITE